MIHEQREGGRLRPSPRQDAKAVKKKVAEAAADRYGACAPQSLEPEPRRRAENSLHAGPDSCPRRPPGRPLRVRDHPVARAQSRLARWASAAAGEMVYAVTHGDISAVVSRTAVFIFDPTRENALAHEHVIETVMKTHTIIPMSFGTVFRTDDDIREVLRSIYPSVKDVLKQMSGKVEFGLKVTWDRDHIVEELQRDHEEIHRFHQEITRKHLQSTYFARMQLGRMIDKALDRALGGVCARDLRSAARHLRGLARQQADWRQDDHERGVPD